MTRRARRPRRVRDGVYRRRDPAATAMFIAACLLITVAVVAAVIALTDWYLRSTT